MIRDLMAAFLTRAKEENTTLEGAIAWEGEQIVFEEHLAEDLPRNIYSHTKSFTSAAVGMAVSEGILNMSDKPAEFFPESLPTPSRPGLKRIELHHLLTMSSGIDQPLLMMPGRYEGVGAPDYMKYVLHHPRKLAPGSKFCYSNGDTYMAGRMVEKAAGMTLREYLTPRLFDPLHIPVPEWEHCPMGHTFGASGMKLRLRDMSKLGVLYLQKGAWEGKRLLSEEWVKEASEKHIDTTFSDPEGWSCGYGYQFWMSPYPRAFRADGAYGQISMVLPEKGLVVAVQCREGEGFDRVRAALHQEVFTKL